MGRRDAASQQMAGWTRLPGMAAALLRLALLPVALGPALSGCASMSEVVDTASQLPKVGLPANAPERPAQPMAFPAIHDVPPPRTAAVLTDIEQRKLETDLVSARNQQQAAAGLTPAMKAKYAKERADAKKDAKKQAAKDPGKKDQDSKD